MAKNINQRTWSLPIVDGVRDTRPQATLAPIGLTVQRNGTSMVLSWQNDPASGTLTEYKVYESVNAGAFLLAEVRAAVPNGVTATTTRNGTASSTYNYYVTATSSSGIESGPSNYVSVTIPLIQSGNWEQRIRTPGVVWYHDFEQDAEVYNWINMSQNAPWNSFCTLGVHDRVLHAHRVGPDVEYRPGEVLPPLSTDYGLRGRGVLQLVNLGATLAAPIADEYYTHMQTVPGVTFTANTGTASNALDGWITCSEQLTAPYIVAGNAGVNGNVIFKIENAGAASDFYVFTSVTNMGDGTWRYGVQRSKPTSKGFDIGTFSNVVIKSVNLGDPNETLDITLDAANAQYFPNPNFDPAKTYTIAIQSGQPTGTGGNYPAGTIHYPSDPAYQNGPKGIKEMVEVLARNGNILTVRRGGRFAEKSDFGNYGFPVRFPAGTTLGNDADGGWARQFSRVASPRNGRLEDDPGDNDRVPLRDPDGALGSYHGYYGHAFYHTNELFNNFKGLGNVWDGDEFWIQFQYWLSPNRYDFGMPGAKAWFVDSMHGLTSHQCVGEVGSAFEGLPNIGNFGNKGAEQYTHPQGGRTDAYLQPDVDNPNLSEYPDFVVGNASSGGRQWPLGEWVTVKLHLRPGFAADNQVPVRGDQLDPQDSLRVDTTYFTPVNSGTTITYETTVPQPWKFGPQNRSENNYFVGWKAVWPNSILGDPPPQVQALRGTTTQVTATELIDHGGGVTRLRWTVGQSGNTALPAGVPANNDLMQANFWNPDISLNGLSMDFKRDVFELFVKRASEPEWVIFRKRNYYLEYGSEGEKGFDNDPPAWNRFQPTGYANINDNLAPGPQTAVMRWGQVIFSRQDIPWPDATDVTPGTPTWFTGMDADTWYPIATQGAPLPPTGTLEAWQQGTSLYASVPNITAAYDDLCQNNNGGVIIPEYKEFALVANGGHSGNFANDGYSLDLSAEIPYWYQLVESTPEEYTDVRVSTGSTPGLIHSLAPYPADGSEDTIVDANGVVLAQPYFVPPTWADGPEVPYIADANYRVNPEQTNYTNIRRRPRSLHNNAIPNYNNGKIWWPFMNAPNVSGRSHGHKLSLDFAGCKTDYQLTRWSYGNLGPWQYHGPISEYTGTAFTTAADFGAGAIDRVSGIVWYHAGAGNMYWGMETTTDNGLTPGEHTYYTTTLVNNNALKSGGTAICRLPKSGGGEHILWVMQETSANDPGSLYIRVYDLSETPHTYSRVLPLNAENYEWAWGIKYAQTTLRPNFTGYAMGWGMVWHEPSQCFLAYNCDHIPPEHRNRVRKLIPPMSGGVYNPGGDWTWSEAILSDVNGMPEQLLPGKLQAGGGASSYTRFNLIPNFDGQGNALLLHQSAYNTPTWVAKIGAI